MYVTPEPSSPVWYDRPAARWVDGLPVGNGRLGAMIWGPLHDQRLSLNEDTFWSGPPPAGHPAVPAGLLDDVRADLRAGRHTAAGERLKAAQGRGAEAYQPVGDLVLRVARQGGGGSGAFRFRELDLGLGVARHVADGVEQTVFADAATGLLVIGLHAPGGRLTAELSWRTPQLRHDVRAVDGCGLALLLHAPSHVGDDADHRPVVEHGDGGMAAAALAHVYCHPGEGDAGDGDPGDDAADGGGPVAGAAVGGGTVGGAAVGGGPVAGAAVGGGTVEVADGSLRVRDAARCTILVDVRTGFTAWNRAPRTDPEECLARAAEAVALARGRADLLPAHAAAHAAVMGRVRLRLGAGRGGAEPLDVRLRASQAGPRDEQLAAVLFDFGRYLLLASSRPGTQAAHLQGLWNDSVTPPWHCDYTVNINTQMNYWPAESTALPECHGPLLDLVADLADAGRGVARELYGADGWTCHHNTDLWRATWPVGEGNDDPVWSSWPLGGAWLSLHLAEHWRYGRDRRFLRDRAWPAAAEAARFLLGLLHEDPDDPAGHLITAPATSPENRFATPDGPASVDRSTTMDLTLARELFGFLAESAAEAGPAADPELVAAVTAALRRLRPPGVGSRGELLEWHTEHPETEPHHRHVSHLVGLHPGRTLTDPRLRAAARRSLELRGDEGTGWSTAWKTALWARLGDGAAAHRLLGVMLRPVEAESDGGGVYPSLLCAHPPFQIDGNFGATAAIAEMLVQSRGSELLLLPAVPPAWPDGTVSGLRAHGAVTVERLAWAGGALSAATLRAARDTTLTVRWPGAHRTLSLRAGTPYDIRP
ncbi:glycosyl hydrolase family 95 catalytic domain-containing protein [Streptomyces sp. NRRL F-5123]|uniref:glycosyl hydrolase family 95 catalytic domain-containing protein n=1 Tax=Streptomyces sp. NRRL F-5123 TaxID=1463856 RepID=UPI0006949D0A|nr:glycoside hydrolase N-terminal domain-containing protein [Streptomyces sp. NRRL F-5123]